MFEGCNCSSRVMFLFSLRPRWINSESHLTLGLARWGPDREQRAVEGLPVPLSWLGRRGLTGYLLQHLHLSPLRPHRRPLSESLGKFVERHRSAVNALFTTANRHLEITPLQIAMWIKLLGD